MTPSGSSNSRHPEQSTRFCSLRETSFPVFLKCCPSTDPVTLNDQDLPRAPKKQNKVNQTENEEIQPGGSPSTQIATAGWIHRTREEGSEVMVVLVVLVEAELNGWL